jgi:Glycosyl transferases group 1
LIVGGGLLAEPLEQLASHLGIGDVVEFVGATYAAHLPALLRGVDVIVNPSLRAASETFCIANIEVRTNTTLMCAVSVAAPATVHCCCNVSSIDSSLSYFER